MRRTATSSASLLCLGSATTSGSRVRRDSLHAFLGDAVGSRIVGDRPARPQPPLVAFQPVAERTQRVLSSSTISRVASFTSAARPSADDRRPAYASRALALGESLTMIGKLLSHTQVQTTARYAHLARASIQNAAARITGSIGGDLTP